MMRCGNCDKTDGVIYTSNPPKVKCSISNEYHFFEDQCNVLSSAIAKDIMAYLEIGTTCIVCGESVLLTQKEKCEIYHGKSSIDNKVCDKCRRAILKMRESLNED